MTRGHRRAHVWLWFAVGAFVGSALVAWGVLQLRGEP